MAYALVGKPLAHKLLVIWGPGGNGKDTLMSILRNVMGSYATMLDRNVIVQSGKADHLTGLAQARGKRLWCVSEIEEGDAWNESRIKGMSGGVPITARNMRENMGTFPAEGTFMIATNFVPPFHRIDASITRRFRMIQARLRVPAEAEDLEFEAKTVASEGPAILWNLMQQAKQVIADKMRLPEAPPAMAKETTQWLATQDVFAAWFQAEMVACPLAAYPPIAVEELEQRYKMFVQRNSGENEDEALPGTDSLGPVAFLNALRRAGAIMDDGSGKPGSLKNERGRAAVAGIKFKVSAVRRNG
jgi:putative DNA primase/helicase